MYRHAEIWFHKMRVGLLQETEEGYHFQYEKSYLESDLVQAVSKTLQLSSEPYSSNVLFPFFDGLIPEGWLLDIAEKNWKINQKDRFGLLLACCEDTIGAVSVRAISP